MRSKRKKSNKFSIEWLQVNSTRPRIISVNQDTETHQDDVIIQNYQGHGDDEETKRQKVPITIVSHQHIGG